MRLCGWGRYPVIETEGHTFEMSLEAARLLARPGHWISHGLGKSYGDCALNQQVLMTRRFNKLLDFDCQKGVVTCESGITLAELIDVFLPKGWFLQVVPGTKLVTVGGAIASDVHGKNHHMSGCFSESVINLRLMLPNGTIRTCSQNENRELFCATCGGMGLTGLILDATLQLLPVKSAFVQETVINCRNLTEACAQFEEHDDSTYSVAWIDCLAKGERMGRSVLMIGEHAQDGRLEPFSRRTAFIPMEVPGFFLNKYSISLFNHLYFAAHSGRDAKQLKPIDDFFFPLDRFAEWNRIYGTKGFTQYQFVLPKCSGVEGIHAILKKVVDSEIGSFLAVLKCFGPGNENYLSFPMEGYTLALDLKIQPHLFSLLDELDRIVVDHGGRLYLAKDVRMQRSTILKGYPKLEMFREIRSKFHLSEKLNSLQSIRLGI